MNDKQLAAFIATSELGSMNRAAEQLYLSQPALKKQIDGLETELGCTLFTRTSTGCALTHAGTVFKEGAGELLERMESLCDRTRASASSATIRICMLPDIMLEQMDQWIIEFPRAHPNTRIERVPLPTKRWIQSVRDRTADLCSCFSTTGAEPFERQGLTYWSSGYRDAVCCFVANTHPLARRADLALDDLRGHKLFVGTLLYHYAGWKTLARQHGLDAVPSDEAADRYELIAKCEQGWVCVHPKSFSHALRPLISVELKDAHVTSGWVYRPTAAPVVKAFVEEAATRAAERRSRR